MSEGGAAPRPPPPPDRVIGLGLDKDIDRFRFSKEITWKQGGWQKAGLTDVEAFKAEVDLVSARRAFRQAANRADAITFDVTSFDPAYPKPGMTYYDFQHILGDPALLAKTTFVKGGHVVRWTGTEFVQ